MRGRTVTWGFLAACLAGCREPEPLAPDPGHTRLTRLGARAEDPCAFGGEILFALGRRGLPWGIQSLSARSDSIAGVVVDDADVRSPALAPDGRTVAFASNRRGSWDVFTVSPGSPKWTLVAGGDADETGPTWSPDGKRLAYAALAGGEWTLQVRPLDGEARELGPGFAPCWHPKRDVLVCQRTRSPGGAWAIMVVDIASGRATDVWPEEGRCGITPSWSADGNWILFAAQSGGGPDGLWAVAADGSRRVRLTEAGVEEWSPREIAGGRIVYCRREGEAVELWSFPSPLR